MKRVVFLPARLVPFCKSVTHGGGRTENGPREPPPRLKPERNLSGMTPKTPTLLAAASQNAPCLSPVRHIGAWMFKSIVTRAGG